MRKFIMLLNENNVDYRIINELPNGIKILVKYSDKGILTNLLRNSGFDNVEHDLCKNSGYIYRYQLHELELYVKGKKMIEICYELYCMSLTLKTLIPLDKLIQNEAWNKEVLSNHMKFLSEDIYIVFLITQCVFLQKNFDDHARQFLYERREILQTEKVYMYLKKVFFSYTEQLISLVSQNKFENIYFDYISFMNY